MGTRIPSKGIQTGYNFDQGAYRDTAYVRCSRCGFICNTERDLRSHSGGYEGWGTLMTAIDSTGTGTGYAPYSDTSTITYTQTSVVDSNTVFLMLFNNTFKDYSVNNVPTTNHGVTFASSSPEFAGVPYASFDGSSYATSTTGSLLLFGNSNFTIDCWVNFSSLGVGNYIFDTRDFGGSNGILLGYNSSFSGIVVILSGDHGSQNNSFGFSTTGAWTHIAVVQNGNTNSMYLNGISQGNNFMNSKIVADAGAIHIGTWAQFNSFFLNGSLGALRFSTGTRWTSNFTPPQYSDYISTSVSYSIVDSNPNSSVRQTTLYDPTIRGRITKYNDATSWDSAATYDGPTIYTESIYDAVVGAGCPQCGTILYNNPAHMKAKG